MHNPRPQTWIKPFADLRASSSYACNQQVLNRLKATVGPERNTRLVMLWIQQANFHNAYSEYRLAETIARQAGQLADSLNIFRGWARLSLSRSLFGQESDFPATYATAQEALELARQEHDRVLEMQALSLLGNLNRRVYFGASLKAIPYHESALAIAISQHDTVQIAQEMMALAMNYEDARQHDRQAAYMLKITGLLARRPMPRVLGRIYILSSALPLGESRAGLQHLYQTALRVSQLTGEAIQEDNVLNALYDFYVDNGQFDKAKSLLPRLDSLYALMARHKSYVPSTNLRHYANRKRMGDVAGALAYLEKEYSSVTHQYQTQNSVSLAQWEATFQTKEKDRLLLQQRQQQRYLVSVIVLISLLLITGGIAFYHQLKNRRAIGRQMKVIERQAEQLQRVDQMKTHFFANVSHELRTPLTLILGPLSSVLNRQRLDASDAKLIRLARRNARQLLELVNEILDLSKLEAGKIAVALQPVQLSNMVRLIVANFESLAYYRDVAFTLTYDAPESLTVELDTDKLRKVLNNLLSNAFKVTQAGDAIVLGVGTHDGKLRLWVSDTGRGIHPDDLPYVFDRYFQTNRTDTVIEGGTGIGLALCQEYVRTMQGKLWVESQWGQGTTFFLELPWQETSASVPELEAGPDEPQGAPTGLIPPVWESAASGDTILVVEDNPHLRDYLTMILQPRFTLLTAENGQEALQQLTQADKLPSLIITDVMMPLMDGFQLLDSLKTSDIFRLIPVVMLTARADKTDKLRALRIGVDDYLLKPFDEEELIARITSLLANQKERQRQVSSQEEVRTGAWATAVERESGQTVSAADMAWLEKLETATFAQLSNANLTAERLADDIAVSRSTLFREVKRLTGLTPTQYITEARFQRARQLLEDREVSSVKQLAQLVGFRQANHFSTSYKKQFGKSPSDYF
ncbi:response regulator [Spirosoma taeanense]|uniref:histidine kinase n=1 Tax=Spirosoma taeanense TaxID=2735870 RepID=A0A6M5Y8C4_9BACT|nr:response regulator [Spirosoma taeanense]QJW90215.1 response regulator [Spirosoma taeanense]